MIINDLAGHNIVFDTKNRNTELDTLLSNITIVFYVSQTRIGEAHRYRFPNPCYIMILSLFLLCLCSLDGSFELGFLLCAHLLSLCLRLFLLDGDELYLEDKS